MKRAVSPSLWVLFTAFVVLVAGPGCKPNTRDNPEGCDLYPGDTMCPSGQTCDHANYRCVPIDAGAAGQGVAGSDGTGGAGAGAGGGGGDDAGIGGVAGAGSGGTGLGGSSVDGGGMDAPSIHCQNNLECQGKLGPPACNLDTNLCVECVNADTCSDTRPACDTTSNKCVECTTTDTTACVGTKTLCDPGQHLCVECEGDGDCKTAEKSFCSKNACVACADNSACKTRDLTKPVCAASGACVECDTDKDCGGTTPFCGAQKTCVSCVGATSGKSCADLNNGATPFCGASGACVQCGSDMNCAGSPTTPFCSDAGTCIGCLAASTRMCSSLNPSKPACSTTTGACVECVANNDCPDAKPVCSSSNTCGACTADTDCTNRGPAVCMAHLDGRCASAKETIYVQNNSSCSDASGSSAGTATAPFCSMQAATAAVSSSRAVMVIRGTVGGASSAFSASVSIIGQGGTIAGTVDPALHVSSGTLYARDLQLSTFDSIGLRADAGSTVQLDRILVTGNAGQSMDSKGGGIFLDGAAFDISNTTVSNNGPGAVGSTGWGGILVNSLPNTGPKSLRLVTVKGNNPFGISCASTITATGVLATGNTSTDILPACGFTSCGTASMSCGAQP